MQKNQGRQTAPYRQQHHEAAMATAIEAYVAETGWLLTARQQRKKLSRPVLPVWYPALRLQTPHSNRFFDNRLPLPPSKAKTFQTHKASIQTQNEVACAESLSDHDILPRHPQQPPLNHYIPLQLPTAQPPLLQLRRRHRKPPPLPQPFPLPNSPPSCPHRLNY